MVQCSPYAGYGQLEAIKLSRLRSEVDAGLDALRQADFIELDQDEMLKATDEIKSAGPLPSESVKWRLSAPARADLDGIWRYTSEQWSQV